MIHFWWWEYNLREVRMWTFTEYIFIIMYIILYFTSCQLLYPADVKDYGDNYKNYFFSRKKWLFLLLIVVFFIDIFDTLIKGHEYLEKLMPVYAIRMISHISLLGVFAFLKTKRSSLYGAMVLFFILFELYFIFSKFYND